MNSFRSLLALLFAASLASSLALAESADAKKSDAKPAKAACGCVVSKDGKVCGVDKDCCCTGEKAKGRPDEKKTEKTEDSKSAAKTDCADCGTCKA